MYFFIDKSIYRKLIKIKTLLSVPVCVQSIAMLLFTRTLGHGCSTQKQMIKNWTQFWFFNKINNAGVLSWKLWKEVCIVH